MGIKDKYYIESVTVHDYIGWVLKKHYAHRKPCVSHAYGLYRDKQLQGVCTFGMPANYVEMEAWQPYPLLELNRLCVNSGLPSNVLSYFVSQSIKSLPSPVVLISYADIDWGHCGYIYQATNWYYTGIGAIQRSEKYLLKDGSLHHRRHNETIPKDMIESVVIPSGKHRYYYFHGNKREKKKMRSMLRYSILPYPKGINQRYKADFKPLTQDLLF